MPDKLPKVRGRLYRGVMITKEGLMEALETDFAKYGIENQVGKAEKVIQCESGFLWYAQNPISKGVAQFTPATWKDFGYGDIMNPYSQLEIMAKMWSKGLQKRWDCYIIIYNESSN